MIEDIRGNVDYEASGTGPNVVLVPGSCSTGAAWRPVMASWNGAFRCVTTSLPGYGGTTERRPRGDPAIAHLAEAVERAVHEAGEPVHLVGHSFGGLVSLAVAMRKLVRVASIAMLEPPAIELLLERGEDDHYRAFGRMTEHYVAAFNSGERDAIGAMIDFYGGAGTFASWPSRVREYAVATTAVNITDWASAYGFSLSADALSRLDIPALVVCGEKSHPAMRKICALVGECISGAGNATVDGAAHFMIATHASEVARLVAEHVRRAEGAGTVPAKIVDFSRENKDALNDIGATRCHLERTPTQNVGPFAHSS
jgi:pimeloyl-ACP methyl ester carboxylesterase